MPIERRLRAKEQQEELRTVTGRKLLGMNQFVFGESKSIQGNATETFYVFTWAWSIAV